VLDVWNGGQIAAVEGARLVKAPDGKTELILELPKRGAEPTPYAAISIQFNGSNEKGERTKR